MKESVGEFSYWLLLHYLKRFLYFRFFIMQRYAEIDGGRLRQLRLERALTQHDLCQITGMSQDSLSRLENERRHARPSTIRRLAHALEVAPRELIKTESRNT